MKILHPTGSGDVYLLGKFLLIDKKFFGYIIYGWILLKCGKEIKRKVFEIKVIGRV